MPPRNVPEIHLRAARSEDRDLLYEVYASTRTGELEGIGWDLEQKSAFLTQQFSAQHAYYQENYGDASFQVILAGGRPAGRLYVARWPEEIRIVDIALLPEFRGAGIGTRLIGELLEEGASAGKPVTIHVEKFNPAMSLYQRLGFVPVEDRGVYLLMQNPPPVESQVNTAS